MSTHRSGDLGACDTRVLVAHKTPIDSGTKNQVFLIHPTLDSHHHCIQIKWIKIIIQII